MATLYTAHATAIGGRNGHTETDDKRVSLDLATPGGNRPGSNPEQLFAAGYAACFGSAVEHVAKLQKLEVKDVKVQADVSLNQDDTGFSISVALNVSIPSIDAATTQKLVEAAHKVCPYSKATRNNVQVTLKANGEALKQAA